MDCPRCNRPTRVLESRRAEAGAATRRRRECSQCGHRFTTYERGEGPPLAVIKRHGGRQRFECTKLRAALLRSTHKRQVGADDVERLVERVAAAIEAAGGELGAARIGELCLDGLAELDRGAYLQFLGTLPSQGPRGGAAGSTKMPAANTKRPAGGVQMPDFAESAQAGSVRAARESASLSAEAAEATQNVSRRGD